MSDPDIRSVHVLISGRVQGVSYRAWCADEAVSLGLTGWVRNRSDGAVEALFCGPQAAISTMLQAAEDGPIHARVEGVAILGEGDMETEGFEIRPTV
ncbi:acylphosphatase [Roseibium aquae]|nr:acylphosphatase [Roseibium aquae]